MRLSGKDIVRAIKCEGEDRAFTYEMRNRKSALVGGVIGVDISSPEKISIRLVGGGELIFIGKKLCCTSFGNRSVEIEGKICSVNFEAIENEENNM